MMTLIEIPLGGATGVPYILRTADGVIHRRRVAMSAELSTDLKNWLASHDYGCSGHVAFEIGET